MSKPHNKAVRASLSFRQLLLVATGVGLAFVAYSVVFGSGDIEEAANSSYSIGALPPERRWNRQAQGFRRFLEFLSMTPHKARVIDSHIKPHGHKVLPGHCDLW